ncbi:hypothetical protein [Moheibacter sediminis]|uniref:Uncharacterized protein n=1 Tax=Moheibacter sediminis TaxID=1434700 RepID=A0A1W1ZEC3_9FLAO|nr:hypothetical protein [Moheibacter sediminis]SMC46809.1 hypothetical protein SAMN06296427_102433 [Moheibacter sediminis]
MKYTFFIQKISKSTIYSVRIEDAEFYVLGNLTDISWIPAKAQEIIDGVKSTIDTDVEYQWANEDVFLVSHPTEGVIFWDLMKTRGQGSGVRTTQDLVLPHEEFITFMEDFKKFIEENN